MDYIYIIAFCLILTVALFAVVWITGKLMGATMPQMSAMILGGVFMNSGNYGAPVVLFAFGAIGFDYAVVMMSAAARACGATRLNATLLAGETGLPLPTVQKLVSRLSAAGLIESSRGTGGGFRLSRPPASISLADIIEAVEGPIALTTCVDAERHDCAVEGACRVRPHMPNVNGAVRGALAGVSLATLSSEAHA